jgi:hypothetical protein
MDNGDTCAFFVLFFLFFRSVNCDDTKMIHHTRRKRIEICAARTNSQIMHTRCKRIETCAARKKVAGPASQHRDLLLLQRRPVPPPPPPSSPQRLLPWQKRMKEWKKERENRGIISSSCSPSSHYSYFHLLTPHPTPWLDWGTGTQWKSVFFSHTIHHSLFILISLISNYKFGYTHTKAMCGIHNLLNTYIIMLVKFFKKIFISLLY